jgi:hypothetical protein
LSSRERVMVFVAQRKDKREATFWPIRLSVLLVVFMVCRVVP